MVRLNRVDAHEQTFTTVLLPRCNFCRLCNYFGPRDDSSEYFQYFQSFQWPYEIIKIGVLAKRVGLQHMAT